MIPNNPFIYGEADVETQLQSAFQFPDNVVSPVEIPTDFEMGGIALQDPTEGLFVKPWKVWWDKSDDTVYIKPVEEDVEPLAIFTEPDVQDLTFTFDQNMRWIAATRKEDNSVTLRWYDPQIEAYTVSHWTGWTSIKLAHDTKFHTFTDLGLTDVILTYLESGQLKWRIQRDRYTVPYVYGNETFPARFQITHFGLNVKNRLQWRIGPRRRSS